MIPKRAFSLRRGIMGGMRYRKLANRVVAGVHGHLRSTDYTVDADEIRDIWWSRFARISTVQGRIIISNRTPYQQLLVHDAAKVRGYSTWTLMMLEHGRSCWVKVFRWKSGLTELHIPLWLPVILWPRRLPRGRRSPSCSRQRTATRKGRHQPRRRRRAARHARRWPPP